MMAKRWWGALVVVLGAGLPACSGPTFPERDVVAQDVSTGADVGPGDAALDATADTREAGGDAGADAQDAARDASADAPRDAVMDAAMDVAADAPRDSAMDVAADARSDAALAGDSSSADAANVYVLGRPFADCNTTCAERGLTCAGFGTVGLDCAQHASDPGCSTPGFWIYRVHSGEAIRCLDSWGTSEACGNNYNLDNAFCCHCR